jgi:methyl-accepting chemotaxis protein
MARQAAAARPMQHTNGRSVAPTTVLKQRVNGAARDAEMEDLQGLIAAIDKSQAVIEFTMEGIVVKANENFLKTTGYRLSEIVGQHHRLFVDPAYGQSAEYRDFWAILNRGEFQSLECKRFGKSGNEIWLQASYNPILDAQGTPHKVVKYAYDITAQKMALQTMMEDVAMLSKAATEGNLEARADVSRH